MSRQYVCLQYVCPLVCLSFSMYVALGGLSLQDVCRCTLKNDFLFSEAGSSKGLECMQLKDFDSLLDKYMNVPGRISCMGKVFYLRWIGIGEKFSGRFPFTAHRSHITLNPYFLLQFFLAFMLILGQVQLGLGLPRRYRSPCRGQNQKKMKNQKEKEMGVICAPRAKHGIV